MTVVAQATLMVRVHGDRPAVAFNPTLRPAQPPGGPVLGGRFDTLDGSYAYLYAADSEEGAFADVFARDLNYTIAGPRPLPRARIAGKEVSVISAQRDIRLVVVHGAGAQQLGQDDWLTRCDEDGYPVCREWAAAIRTWVPEANGLTWRSKRDPDRHVYVLWGDPDPMATSNGCGLVEATPISKVPLEHGAARVRLDRFLIDWRLYIEP
jgi:hypothetical protein